MFDLFLLLTGPGKNAVGIVVVFYSSKMLLRQKQEDQECC